MQAVILAAGEGKRVRPLTRSRPKALIPVANRPIIEYVIEALLKNGIRDIIVVAGYRKEQVTRFLNQLDVSFDVVVQPKQLGTGNALQCAEPRIKGDFLLLPGDNYIDPHSVARIIGKTNAMLVKDHPNPSNFGVVMMQDGYVKDIIEKPEHAQSLMVSTGIYALSRDVFSFIQGNDLPEAITAMIRSGIRVEGVPADDWQDAIFAWDLLKMNRRLLHNLLPAREGVASRQTIIQGAVRIGKGTTIGPNTVISGPVVIGSDCTIGPNTCILPNTSIGARVAVEPFSVLGNALIMDDATIGSHSRIMDTVIGERCALSDHTSTCTTAGALEIEGTLVKSEFGAIFGDTVAGGPFSTYRNSILGNNVTVEGHGRLTSRIIPDGSMVI
jgi:glucose-1-phosphate thymidylyltransferase